MNSKEPSYFWLKILFGGISAAMIAITVHTSIQSNLFEVWNELGAQPWMRATLWDFYFNITIISAWVVYKEKKVIPSVFWIIAFILLGSIATAFYVFLQFMKLKPGDSITQVLLPRK